MNNEERMNDSQNQILINQPMAIFTAYDEDDMQLYAHATGYYLALFETHRYVHNILKYGADMSDETIRILGDIEQFIVSQYHENHLPLE